MYSGQQNKCNNPDVTGQTRVRLQNTECGTDRSNSNDIKNQDCSPRGLCNSPSEISTETTTDQQTNASISGEKCFETGAREKANETRTFSEEANSVLEEVKKRFLHHHSSHKRVRNC